MSISKIIPTSFQDILDLIDQIDPVKYGKTRNFTNGAVSYLSPYISRGVVDTKMIFSFLKHKDFTYKQSERLIQQLMWREYFQRVWQEKGESINNDIKRVQDYVTNHELPSSIIHAQTGIEAIDKGVEILTTSGIMHNHLRMYTASLTCNLCGSHWLQPARWMYYHLLDADWGTNALSWQWVAGTFSSKKYIANQENINYYTGTKQSGTYLDVSYDILQDLQTPPVLKKTEISNLRTSLPHNTALSLNADWPLLIYNFYNLSPEWRSEMSANKVLLLEPDIFEKYPVSDKTISFMLELSKNIEGIQIFIGSFNELKSLQKNNSIFYREHPLNSHYSGTEDPRPWILPDVKDTGNSFMSFWKKNEKTIQKNYLLS